MCRDPRTRWTRTGIRLLLTAVATWALLGVAAIAQEPAPAQPSGDEPAGAITGVNLENLSIGDLAGMVSATRQTPTAPQEWSCLGCHETQIEAEAWMASLHRNSGKRVTCTDCHPEAEDVPHPDEVSSLHCERCHDGMGHILTSSETTAMGHRPGAENGCAGCHDPHTMSAEIDAAAFVEAGCRECHDADEGLADKHSKFFCQPELHLAKVGCLHCHLEGDDSEAVHNVKFGEAADLGCDDCHGADSVLALAAPLGEEEEASPLKMQNRKLARETGYLIGANRIWGLDILIILMVVGSLGFPIVHGGLRIIFAWKSK